MKRFITLLVLLVSGFAFAQTKETRNVGTFTKISFRTAGKLILKQGSPQSVVLEGDQETLSKIETDVDGSRLTIGRENHWRDWSWRDEKRITAYVTVADIEALNVSGSGDLEGQGKFTTGDLELKVSGSGSIDIEVDAKGQLEADVSGSGDLSIKGSGQSLESSVSGSGKVNVTAAISGKADVSVSGSGKVTAGGTAQEIKATISGSGKVMAANLEVSKCEVRISGSGDVEINVKDSLDANISGSGSVTYKGNPNQVNSHSSGSGHVRKVSSI
jgi:hypothetical protein